MEPTTPYAPHITDKEPADGVSPDHTVILIHGSASSSRLWSAFLATQEAGEHIVAPDLPGYGHSSSTPGVSAHLQGLSTIRAAIDTLGEQQQPLDLVGHSYGGALALDYATSHPDRLRSLTLIEPTAFNLLRVLGDNAWGEIELLSREHIRLVEEGTPALAADAFMGYWIGKEAWNAMPEPRRQSIVGMMPTVAEEWRWMRSPSDSRLAEYRGLGVPTQLILGSRTTTAARRTLEILSQLLPAASVEHIAGAGHLSPLTHASVVNALIRRFVRRVEKQTPQLLTFKEVTTAD
ncbi:MAG: alpha/beta hydrolase [Ectothiorhodospiraceae bacterium]|nr:alpha/beta hydrolase [Ectothiorhodospiraceae bacterium]MCH8503492.1 alpha/beta hydrolase [Ectothiorhodospiraceae bacterium]